MGTLSFMSDVFFKKRNKSFSPDNAVQMFSISTHTKKENGEQL